ncbi:unnamed protein product, partial [Ranitomeya imitator]
CCIPSQTGDRSDEMSFPGIAVHVVSPLPSSSTRGPLNFAPPPAIYLSPVLCSSSNKTVSGTTNLTCSLPYYLSLKDCRQQPPAVESRRITHISAEQKRRCNIKLGFDTLQNLVTNLHVQHNNKFSKATILQKTADYIYKLQQERTQLQEESQCLRRQVQELSDTINGTKFIMSAQYFNFHSHRPIPDARAGNASSDTRRERRWLLLNQHGIFTKLTKRVLAGRNDGGLCWMKDEGLYLETSLYCSIQSLYGGNMWSGNGVVVFVPCMCYLVTKW